MKENKAFEGLKRDSLDYLETVDSRNFIGWEKVDLLLQNTVDFLYANPRLFHYGESHAGHVYAYNFIGSGVSIGHIQIGIDGSEDSLRVITRLEQLAEDNDYVVIRKQEVPYYEEGKELGTVSVHYFLVDVKNLSGKAQAERSLEEHFIEYKRFWGDVEGVLRENCGKFPSLWDRDKTKHLRPDWSPEVLEEQAPLPRGEE